jgi:predicted AlkP superfamily phosphohydrolase/phosphomutase
MINNVGDATVIVPMIKDYLEVSVKNDDALVKLAAVVQRLVAGNKRDEEGSLLLTDEERDQLLKTAEEEIEKIKSGEENDRNDRNSRSNIIRSVDNTEE